MNQTISFVKTCRRYPFSLAAYLLTLIPWLMVISIKVRMWISKPALGAQDISVGEGLMYGVLLSTFFSALLLVVTLINLAFGKNKTFYTRLFMLVLFSSLFFYAVLSL